eukprot:8213635-Ditylum_brightwellii.AAC.1
MAKQANISHAKPPGALGPSRKHKQEKDKKEKKEEGGRVKYEATPHKVAVNPSFKTTLAHC